MYIYIYVCIIYINLYIYIYAWTMGHPPNRYCLGKLWVFFCEVVLQNLCSTHSLSGGATQNCNGACEDKSGTCDLNKMKSAPESEIESAFRNLNRFRATPTTVIQDTDSRVIPGRSKRLGIMYTRLGTTVAPLFLMADRSEMTCDENGGDNAISGTSLARMCYGTPGGIVTGDPHIQTLHGAHYTLLREGTFRAWSFKKGQADLELLAAYGGPRWGRYGQIKHDKTR